MNKVVSAHLDLEKSSDRLRKATAAEQDIVSQRNSLEYKISDIKKEIQRVWPEVFNQVSDITERIRNSSLTVCGHTSGIRPRAQQDPKLSASEKSLYVLRLQIERLIRVNQDVRTELNKQLDDFQQDNSPSRKGLSSPSLFHFSGSPFESDAIELAITTDILHSLKIEIEEFEKKFDTIHSLQKSGEDLQFDLKDAQDSILREKGHKLEASTYVDDCDKQFQAARGIVHTYLVQAGNWLIDTLVQVDAEVHQGASPKESSLAQTCQALGSLLYVSSSRQSLMGVSDLENKINLLAKTIGALDLEFGLQLTPNAVSKKSPATNQVIKIPPEAFQLSELNLLHEHGYRNRESSDVLFPNTRCSPEQVRVVPLNHSHLFLVAELLDQTWQKTLSHNEILSILKSEGGFGFIATDSTGTLLGVGIADIVNTLAFEQVPEGSSPHSATTCRLINLTTREEYRKLGCGSIVTRAILSEAAARGAEKTVIAIEADNVAALKYLRDKHQFKSVGIMTTLNLEEYYVLGRKNSGL